MSGRAAPESETVKLLASDAAANDFYGFGVAIDGDTAVVGAFNADGGAVYVYVFSGGSWSEQAILTASDTIGSEEFGEAVSISGETIVVGAPNDTVSSTQHGSAYVFVRSGTTWSEQAKLTPSDGTDDDEFGESISISGDTIVVGAKSGPSASGTGAAYVFVRTGTTWSDQQKLASDDLATDDNFGRSVGISGETIVVGAPARRRSARGGPRRSAG